MFWKAYDSFSIVSRRFKIVAYGFVYPHNVYSAVLGEAILVVIFIDDPNAAALRLASFNQYHVAGSWGTERILASITFRLVVILPFYPLTRPPGKDPIVRFKVEFWIIILPEVASIFTPSIRANLKVFVPNR